MFVLSLAIAAYAGRYVAFGERVYTDVLASSFRARPWGIFVHALAALVALGLGPFQFHRRLRTRRPRLHRALGRIYVGAAVATGLSGVYLAWYAYGGLVTHAGFGLLGAATTATTATAFARIRARDVTAHREWMIRSFALIFAAVTLRLWLPLLIVAYDGAFAPAYLWVSWLCWVPNLFWAELVIRHSRTPPARAGARAPAGALNPARAH